MAEKCGPKLKIGLGSSVTGGEIANERSQEWEAKNHAEPGAPIPHVGDTPLLLSPLPHTCWYS